MMANWGQGGWTNTYKFEDLRTYINMGIPVIQVTVLKYTLWHMFYYVLDSK
jgi:hypothetical protein